LKDGGQIFYIFYISRILDGQIELLKSTESGCTQQDLDRVEIFEMAARTLNDAFEEPLYLMKWFAGLL
jgi:hypothetical protein